MSLLLKILRIRLVGGRRVRQLRSEFQRAKFQLEGVAVDQIVLVVYEVQPRYHSTTKPQDAVQLEMLRLRLMYKVGGDRMEHQANEDPAGEYHADEDLVDESQAELLIERLQCDEFQQGELTSHLLMDDLIERENEIPVGDCLVDWLRLCYL